MKTTYNVEVTRTSFSHSIIEVEADSLEEANELAIEKAHNHEFPSAHNAEYSID